MTRTGLAICLLVALGTAGCQRESAGHPTPTAVATATATMTPAPSATAAPAVVGPLLVYTSSHTTGRFEPAQSWYVVTYDAGAHREVSRFEIGDANERPQAVVLAGRTVIANMGDRIVAYALDGSNARELRRFAARPSASILGVGASADGTKLALNEQFDAPCTTPRADGGNSCGPIADTTRIVVLDLTSGRELLTVPQSAPGFAGFAGQAAVIHWRDDGTGFAVEGYTYSEAPGGLATVLLDGTVRVASKRVYGSYLAPNARYVMEDNLDVCDLSSVIERHTLTLRDLDSGRLLASTHEPVLDIEQGEWSPSSGAYLYRTFALVPGENGCKKAEESTAAWHVLHTDGSPAEEVADPAAVRRQWYGDRLVEYRCLGKPAPESPYCYAPDGSNNEPIEAYIGGTRIASETGFRVVGFVTQP